ncbi:MAG: hypothetical protein AAF141_05575 [Pseudomonadota bacterium]
MADELEFTGDPASQSGLTVIARVYSYAGAQVGGDVTTSEDGGSEAIYTGDMPSAAAGEYLVRFFEGTTLLGQGEIIWDGSQEITLTDIAAAFGSLNDVSAADVNAQVDIALADYDGPTRAELASDVASIPAAVRTNLTPELGRIDANVTSRLAAVDYTTPPTVAEIEGALLNEGDGQQLIDAIVSAIGNVNVDEIALVAAIRADLERVGGALDLVPTLTEIEGSAALAKSAEVAALNDITAAEVWSVAVRTVTGGTIDTNNDMRGTDSALLASGYTPPNNTDIAAIKATTDSLPSNIATVTDVPTAVQNAAAVRADQVVELGRMDAPVTSRAADTDVASIKERTDNLPDDPASQAKTDASIIEGAVL